MKYSLHIGLNEYPNPENNLNGCVNDAVALRNYCVNQKNFDKSVILLNKFATKSRVDSYIDSIINRLRKGDLFVLTYSGHGTSIVDRNGDEDDGKDEALCLYDSFYLDDDLRKRFDKIPEDVTFVFISDCCHSGSITRSFKAGIEKDLDTFTEEHFYSKIRYLPPVDDDIALSLGNIPSKKTFSKQVDEETLPEVLFTGCKDDEFSYDAYFNGKFHGALTYTLLNALNTLPSGTYADIFKLIRESLPSSRYPQTPQISGKTININKRIFT